MKCLMDVMVTPFIQELEYRIEHGGQAGTKAASYLSGVGSLMIRNPVSCGVMSSSRLKRVRGKEMSIEDVDGVEKSSSSVSSEIKHAHMETAFDRMEFIRQSYPGCKMLFATIDTDGVFGYNGFTYRVLGEEYAPEFRRGFGEYYQFDKVLLVIFNDEIMFYNQDIKPTSVIQVGGVLEWTA